MYQITRKDQTQKAFNEPLYYLGYNSSSLKERCQSILTEMKFFSDESSQEQFKTLSASHQGNSGIWVLDILWTHIPLVEILHSWNYFLFTSICDTIKKVNIRRLWKVFFFLKRNLRNSIYHFCLFPIALNLTMLQLIVTRKADE